MGDDAPKPKRICLDLSETITVVVGKEQKEYLVHKSVVTKTSDFFVGAISGSWSEVKEKKVELPGTEPEIFECYAHWLYTGQIPLSQDLSRIEPDQRDNTRRPIAREEYTTLTSLYLLGHFLLDTTFRNAVVTSILTVHQKVRIYPGIPSIHLIWDHTPDGCEMKRIIIRFWAKSMDAEHLGKCQDDLPAGFLLCFVKDLFVLRDSGDKAQLPSLARKCEYHEHDNKVPKCSD